MSRHGSGCTITLQSGCMGTTTTSGGFSSQVQCKGWRHLLTPSSHVSSRGRNSTRPKPTFVLRLAMHLFSLRSISPSLASASNRRSRLILPFLLALAALLVPVHATHIILVPYPDRVAHEYFYKFPRGAHKCLILLQNPRLSLNRRNEALGEVQSAGCEHTSARVE